MRRRYLELGTGEFIAAAVFAAVAAGVISPRLGTQQDVLALWCALVPLLVILVQAGVYWLLARHGLGREPMSTSARAVYRAFRYGNPVMLIVALVAIVVWRPTQFSIFAMVVAVWLFAAVEYVNYYVMRVAYPIQHWPRRVLRRRRPQLVRDLMSVR